MSVTSVRCWAIPVNPYEWVTNSPNLLSLILNFAFLCNIIRVLVTKLRATHTNEPSQFRKAVRATLVLVPLYSLHFFLVIYQPQSGQCVTLESYTFLSYAMDGLQVSGKFIFGMTGMDSLSLLSNVLKT
ncbi:hypothetical protein CEXT_516611 [Caerostris extrusa]|uniref:G-protein coupled receptors family 2 profile 2 domain-containing protein n=1 Tax=Caerostris extrusa TaxID=172846 RepID=A0AAV4PM07_CAEEX|nr:hypothetical protein CEXT_516611 [Caerostris extrusa]